MVISGCPCASVRFVLCVVGIFYFQSSENKVLPSCSVTMRSNKNSYKNPCNGEYMKLTTFRISLHSRGIGWFPNSFKDNLYYEGAWLFNDPTYIYGNCFQNKARLVVGHGNEVYLYGCFQRIPVTIPLIPNIIFATVLLMTQVLSTIRGM